MDDAGVRTTAEIDALARAAREASRDVSTLSREDKDAVLLALAAAIGAHEREILEANAADLAAAEANGVTGAKLKRLRLDGPALAQMRDGLAQLASLDDPVGEVTRDDRVATGLRVRKVRTPLGVVCMIYEARPGVTIDAFALCFKAGNACVLKGGREANRSNALLARIARGVLRERGVPEGAITQLTTSDRDLIRHLLTLDGLIDLVIPRGGETLIRFVHEHSRMPTVQHFHGVCHVYVDASADLERALDIVATGKASAPATCNATECALVHEAVAPAFVPMLAQRCAADGIELRGCPRTGELAGAQPVVGARDDDFGTEFLDLILACRVVGSFDEAIAHIRAHGSDHTDAIVTGDESSGERFRREVQSSCVLVNASTRFNDGFQLGLGAEIGISTTRLHAYGPMGLRELTVERYVVDGEGQTR
ncbi:MAG: glutamate-5-semialdehyde dehydrogenase [Planctomycetota bacterium]